MATPQLLFAGTYDDIDNAWIVPAAILVGSGTGVVATTACFFSGPQGCVIEDIYFIARDLTFTDPANDVRIGHQISYSSDGGVTYTTVATVVADADCPVIWDDTENDYGDFVLDVPLKAFTFVGAGTGGLSAPNYVSPIHIPANVHVMIEIAPVDAGSVYNVTHQELDALDVLVFGYWKG